MKVVKFLLGLIFLGSFAAAIFLGIQYINLKSDNSSLRNEVAGLESSNEQYLKQIRELNMRIFGLHEANSREVETLKERIKGLEKEIEKLNEPPASPDASTPWERLKYSAELGRQKKWGEYWELLDSGLKERCSKENFVARLTASNPTPLEFVFIEQEIGETRATVWVSIKGKILSQRFVLENGEWMIYIEGGSC